MTERIHQLNIHFDPVEDRLLLRVSVQGPNGLSEYRMWLTRRFAVLLWQSLRRAVDESIKADARIAPTGRDEMRQFQQESALAQADFTTPYAQEAAVVPLGKTPILVSKARISRTLQGHHQVSLEAANGPAVNINMTDQLLHAFMKLISNGANNAQWGLNLETKPQARTLQ